VDGATGVALYRRAIEAGDTEAMREVGRRYLDGEGVGVDEAKGVALCRQAIEAGQWDMIWELGNRYCSGRGVRVNRPMGAIWYWKGADAYMESCYASLRTLAEGLLFWGEG
jgi:TPR repeat protein